MSEKPQHPRSGGSGFGLRRCREREDRLDGAAIDDSDVARQGATAADLEECCRPSNECEPTTTRDEMIREIERLRRCLADLRESNARLGREAAALRESEARYRTMVEFANDAIVVAQDGVIASVNRKAESISGFSEEELTSRPFVDFVHPEDREIVYSRHLIGLRGEKGSGMIYPFRIITKNGGTVWVEINPVAIVWEGRPATLNLLADITERKQAENKIIHLAYHDPLTDLPNRMLFGDRLSVALSQARRNNELLGVMLIDLDRFKEVNDTLGHSAGDQLLRALSGRLRSLLRQGDTVARMGGDEFMLLLPSLTAPDGVSIVAEKVRAAITEPYDLGGSRATVSASIGTAVFPIDADDDHTLLQYVDQAMYRAKETGGNRHARFGVASREP